MGFSITRAADRDKAISFRVELWFNLLAYAFTLSLEFQMFKGKRA